MFIHHQGYYYGFTILLVIMMSSWTIAHPSMTAKDVQDLIVNKKHCGSQLNVAIQRVCDPKARDFFKLINKTSKRASEFINATFYQFSDFN